MAVDRRLGPQGQQGSEPIQPQGTGVSPVDSQASDVIGFAPRGPRRLSWRTIGITAGTIVVAGVGGTVLAAELSNGGGNGGNDGDQGGAGLTGGSGSPTAAHEDNTKLPVVGAETQAPKPSNTPDVPQTGGTVIPGKAADATPITIIVPSPTATARPVTAVPPTSTATKEPTATPTEAPKPTIPAEAQKILNDIDAVPSVNDQVMGNLRTKFNEDWASADTDRKKFSAYRNIYGTLGAVFNQNADPAIRREMKKIEDYCRSVWPDFSNQVAW